MIVCESSPSEPGVYYFRTLYGRDPICMAYPDGKRWKILFFRGATPLGPYAAGSLEQARRYLKRYLEPRASRLEGATNHYGSAGLPSAGAWGRLPHGQR